MPDPTPLRARRETPVRKRRAERDEMIWHLVQSGYSIRAVARAFDLGVATVSAALARHREEQQS